MGYELVVGMEIHCELDTKTKIFCGCSSKFGAPPNTQVCPVCLGMPGTLPVLNKTAFEYSIRTALALNCAISPNVRFDRKNYYYPDLPKNYQISQQYQILGLNGAIDIEVNGTKKTIRINNVHLEEDAGKNVHPEHPGADYSLVDLNRAGMPLIEIVTEPDMRSLEEAEAFMSTLKNLLEYLEVSDCKMQEGHLRFEVNVSVRPEGQEKFGTKVEIKNLGSMKVALKCIEYEYDRQIECLQTGERIIQETRLWDEAAMVTRSMRSKEHAQDYRYFPEPDLVEIEVTDTWIQEVKNSLPELADAKKHRFINEYGIPEYDAHILTASKKIAYYYENALKIHHNPKSISNWIMTEVLRAVNEQGIEIDEFIITSGHLAELVKMIDSGTISGKIAKTVFSEMLESGKMPEVIVKEKGLVQISDTSEIEKAVDEVMGENPDAVQNLKNGNQRTLGFIVGQVMKKTRGKANPQIVNELINKKLV